MNIGDDYEVIQDKTTPKGRRIVKKGQWRKESEADKSEVTGDPVPNMTDDQIRDEIEALTGKRPHHRTGRAKLIVEWEAAYGS